MARIETGVARDRDWLEALFREYHDRVLAYAARRVGAEADDVVAEVFTVAWRQRAVVPDDPLPWLYRTAANQILHQRRGEARRRRLQGRLAGFTDRASPTGEPPPDLADAVATRLDHRGDVARLLAELPDGDAEVLRLWGWEGLDAAGIGTVLGCSAATARMRLFRARRRAQRLLPQLRPASVAPPPMPDPIPPSTRSTTTRLASVSLAAATEGDRS